MMRTVSVELNYTVCKVTKTGYFCQTFGIGDARAISTVPELVLMARRVWAMDTILMTIADPGHRSQGLVARAQATTLIR